MNNQLENLELNELQFKRISRILNQASGIHLRLGKEELVRSRLLKRLRFLGLACFDEYVDYIERETSGTEMILMIDALTTNKTSFFRECKHFDFLSKYVLPEKLTEGSKIRIWSAGCSSGEEPYSLAVLLMESIPNIENLDVKILATDICTEMLTSAREGCFGKQQLEETPPDLLKKYFTKKGNSEKVVFQVRDEARALVHFAKLNLMDCWPMKGCFDIIFCRNVMIYFSRLTREMLVERLSSKLNRNGYLFIGHSESLASKRTDLRYVRPSVYVKP
ncbi:MAG: protein-glutamate O-methyltransferase [Candidatus Eisenbacteria bacterium]|uniref:protein-glutamate O-methyltransferase n=1 Tax=Eiseniibacteriota bacterium TaxID=2212470 RepID=A0A948W5N3_UNCEI|nr:protein-glutamate O-methyltransferase [Candidatus Eisenbacteria bacterium]MBU2690190.1 protein-glutamate O-methyltransferase [Candidatus Eisenbacteria bacterium]